MARLSRLSRTQQPALAHIFNIGFASERIKRWTSIAALRRELDRVSSSATDSGPKPSFDEQLRAVQTQFSETPAHVVSKQVAEMGSAFKALVKDIRKQVAAVLTDFRASEPMFMSGIPQGTRYVHRVIYTHKFDQSIKMDITVYVRVEQAEFILMEVRGEASTEVARVGLFDPQSKDRIKEGLEGYFLGRVKELVH
jgi:hypothetical protein